MFVWNAFTCERYTGQPEEIERIVTQAKQNIENAPSEVDREIIDYRKKIEEISDPIAAAPYKLPTTWEPSVFPPLRKRGQPVLFPVENLVAIPGHGRLSEAGVGGGMGGGMGGGPGLMQNNDPAGKRWIVVTGLVNWEKYIKSYQECFEDVAFKQPQMDYPTFLTYRVERAEITDENQDPSTLQWEKPYRGNITQYTSNYSRSGVGQNEMTKTTFINRALVFPLPSRADRDWGEEVYHEPEIPMLDPNEINRMGMHGVGMPAAEVEAAPGPKGDVENEDVDVPMGMGRVGAGGMPMGGMPGEGMMMGGMPGMARGGMVGGGMQGMGANGMVQEETSPYILFRFFDFNVEPGKRYRYRVRLYLTNPNYGVAERYLVPELAALSQSKEEWKQYIDTEWSEPSQVVNMSLDDSVLVAGVSKSTRADSEPSGTITAVHWDYEKGTEVFDEFSVDRGSVANFYDQKMPQMAAAAAGMGGPGMGGPGMGAPGAQAGRQPTEKVDYVTEMLVLDLKGGERLPGRNKDLTEPATMLLFSPNGNLMVRSSVKDSEELEELKNPKAGGMMRGGMPGMMGPGGGMPGEGMMGPGAGMPGPGMMGP